MLHKATCTVRKQSLTKLRRAQQELVEISLVGRLSDQRILSSSLGVRASERPWRQPLFFIAFSSDRGGRTAGLYAGVAHQPVHFVRPVSRPRQLLRQNTRRTTSANSASPRITTMNVAVMPP